MDRGDRGHVPPTRCERAQALLRDHARGTRRLRGGDAAAVGPRSPGPPGEPSRERMNEPRVRRTYRRLLRLAPRRLRDRHASGMEEAFVDAWSEAQRSGRAARWFVWIRAAWDLLLASLVRRKPPRSPLVGVTTERHTVMMGSELRAAVRSFRRQKLATSLVVTMLALGIAANIVIFSLINGLFLRPFAFDEPERLRKSPL